jgi:6-phospho-3-hexuloisomerase
VLKVLWNNAGARVVVVTAQPGGKAPQLGHTTVYLAAQTMADDEVANESRIADASDKKCRQEQILPMGSVYEGAMFVLFEIAVFLLRRKLGETLQSMGGRHTNLE